MRRITCANHSRARSSPTNHSRARSSCARPSTHNARDHPCYPHTTQANTSEPSIATICDHTQSHAQAHAHTPTPMRARDGEMRTGQGIRSFCRQATDARLSTRFITIKHALQVWHHRSVINRVSPQMTSVTYTFSVYNISFTSLKITKLLSEYEYAFLEYI